jgi:hypothetical protein
VLSGTIQPFPSFSGIYDAALNAFSAPGVAFEVQVAFRPAK